jgi:hypothetical protein
MKVLGLITFLFFVALAAGVVLESYSEEKIIVDLDLCWKGVGYQAWNDNIGAWECFMTESEYKRVR